MDERDFMDTEELQMALDAALDDIKTLKDQLDHERWQHAACLTIAEGAKDMPPEELQSEAMRAVKRLRLERDEIEGALGIFESTHEYTLAERVNRLRQAYDRLWDKLHPVIQANEDDLR